MKAQRLQLKCWSRCENVNGTLSEAYNVLFRLTTIESYIINGNHKDRGLMVAAND